MNTHRPRYASVAATRLAHVAAAAALSTLAPSGCIEADPEADPPAALAPPPAPSWPGWQHRPTLAEQLPKLQQRWPPANRAAAYKAFLWCLPDDQRQPFEQPNYPIALGPDGSYGALLRGADQAGNWPWCLRLTLAKPSDAPWLRPPSLLRDEHGEAIARLPLTPLNASQHPSPEQLSCDDHWAQAGLGCVWLDGELLHIQTPPQWLLWLVRLEIPGAASSPIEWLSPMHGDSITFTLPEQDLLTLEVDTIDLNGEHFQQRLTIDRPSWTP